MEFEWDNTKANSNWKKHRVDFHEAATIFGDPLAITFIDPDHSFDEDRFITIGVSRRSRLLIVSHTDRQEHVRIVSARITTRPERKLYEE
ncbi:MAG: BrnT family toxin [Capsulimonadaceae bacterium]